ncbi:hypothetical protein ABK040_003405 [Willaertia magna]
MSKSISQPFDFYCVLDLEGKVEILEFPVLLLNSKTLEIVDTFHHYIRPTKMTEEHINEYVKGKYVRWGLEKEWHEKAISFTECLELFKQFLSKHQLISIDNFDKIHYGAYSYAFITCGNWDIKTQIPKQCSICNIKLPVYFRKWINCKEIYNKFYKARITGMRGMLNGLKIKLEGNHHSGIDDVKNIVSVVKEMITQGAVFNITGVRKQRQQHSNYGLDESKKKVKYQQSIKSWIETVTSEKFSNPTDLHASLKDGVILCGLISKLRGLKYPNYHKEPKGAMFKEMENIAFFMQNCQKAGIKCDWTLKALHKAMDMDAVYNTIIDLSEHFEKNQSEGFTGPFLKLGSSSSLKSTTATTATTSTTNTTNSSTNVKPSTTNSSTSTTGVKSTSVPIRVGSNLGTTTTPSTPTSTIKTTPSTTSTTTNNSSTVGTPVKVVRKINPSTPTTPVTSSNNNVSSPSTPVVKKITTPSTNPLLITQTPPTPKSTSITTPTTTKSTLSTPTTKSTTSTSPNTNNNNTPIQLNIDKLNQAALKKERRVSQSLSHTDIQTLSIGRRSEKFTKDDLLKIQQLVQQQQQGTLTSPLSPRPSNNIGSNNNNQNNNKYDDSEEDEDLEDEDENDEGSIAFNVKKLKDNVSHPSPEYLRSLNQLLESKPGKWIFSFAMEKGVLYLGEIILNCNKKYKSVNEKTIQENALNCLNTLVDSGALLGFIQNPTSVIAMAQLLDKKESIKVRVGVLESLSLICTFSEQGFWCVLDALNQYKIEKKEPKRFYDLVDGLKTERDEKFKTFCLVLFNSLVNTPKDTSTRVLIRNELKDLGLGEIVSKLADDIEKDIIKEEDLKAQIRAFEEEMMSGFIEGDDEEEEEIDVKTVKDPVQLTKLLVLKLGGSAAGTSHFTNVLRNFLQFTQSNLQGLDSTKSEKALLDNWKNVDNIIASVVQDALNSGTIEDVAKREKMLKILMQKQTKKLQTTELEIQKLTKDIEVLKKQQKVEQSSEDKSQEIAAVEEKYKTMLKKEMTAKMKVETEVKMLQKLIKSQKEKIESLKKDLGQEKEKDTSSVDIPKDVDQQFQEEVKKLGDKVTELEKENEELTKVLREKEQLIKQLKQAPPQIISVPTAVPTVVSTGSVPPPPGTSGFQTPVTTGVIVPPISTEGSIPLPPGDESTIPMPPGVGTIPTPPGSGIPTPPGMGGIPTPPGIGVPTPPGIGIPTPPGSGVPMPPGVGVPMPPGVMGVPVAPKVQKLPDLPKRIPKKNVRNFYGEAINKRKVATTAWIKEGIVERTKDIEINVDELEELFSNAPKKSSKDETGVKKKKEFVSFVDPQKSSNLSILLGYMRLENDEIKKAIIDMDEEVLSQQNIDGLKDKTPSEEEIQAIEAYDGEIDLLAPVDRFYLTIKDIPRLYGRLNCWAFKFKFSSDVQEILPDLETILNCAQEITSSKNFKEFLAIVLAIANFLNANSAKKDAYGFTIGSLAKLRDTKATDGKTTLLQYIAVHCSEKAPHLLDLKDNDFASLEDACRVSLPDSLNEVSKLKAGIMAVEKELQHPDWQNKKDDKFVKIMHEFIESGKRHLEEIDMVATRIENTLKQLAELYAEDEKNMCRNPNEFFQQLKSFFEAFKSGYQEYMKQKEAEEKKKEKEKQKQIQQTAIQQKKKEVDVSSPVVGGLKLPGSESIAAIRERKKSIMSGNAFRSRRESRLQTRTAEEDNSLPFKVNLRKTKE